MTLLQQVMREHPVAPTEPYSAMMRASERATWGRQYVSDVWDSEDYLDFLCRRNQRGIARLAARDAANAMSALFQMEDWA